MLYTYQGAAIPENWVHEWLVGMLTELLDAADAGDPPADWADCIPVSRPDLVHRTSIRNARANLIEPLRAITQPERVAIRDAITDQNNLPFVLKGVTPCPLVTALPERVREPLIDYFKSGFNLLTSLEVRQSHYQAVFEVSRLNVCPFCGMEIMKIPPRLSEKEGAPNQDLDHYLPVSIYPLAGSNLKNLVPMGKDCNSTFKGAKDIIHRDDGTLRPAFDPYGPICSAISLTGSEYPPAIGETRPVWRVALEGGDRADTWDDVWDIKRRLKEDVISKRANRWLEDAARVCARRGSTPSDKAELARWLEQSLEDAEDERDDVNGAAQVAFFEFLRDQLSVDGPEQDFELFLLNLFDTVITA